MKLFVAVAVLCLGVLPSSAQTLDSLYLVPGSVREEPTELVGRLDANGVKAAAIIVYSDINGLSFDSNDGIVGNVDQTKPGRNVVFVSADERKLQVFAVGRAPLTLYIRDLGIVLKKGSSWSLRITGNKKNSLGTGWLSVRTEPAGTNFEYELGAGNWVGRTPPFDTIALPSSIYPVRITKRFYRTVDDTIEIKTKERTTRNYTLERYKGTVKIRTIDEERNELTGARLTMNGALMTERTPFKKKMEADRYVIRIELEGYLPVTDSLTLEDDEGESKEFILKKVGVVTFVGTPQAVVTNEETDAVVGTLTAEGRLVRQLPPQSYRFSYRLGTAVHRYSDVDVSEFGGELYDIVHATVDVPSDRITTEIDVPRTEGRTFRWSGLGNGRIAMLSDGIGVEFGAMTMSLTPALLSTVTGFPLKSGLDKAVGFTNIVLRSNPFTLSVGGGSFETEEAVNSTIGYSISSASFAVAEFDWTPFILWEKFSPFVGAGIVAGTFEGKTTIGLTGMTIAGQGVNYEGVKKFSTATFTAGALLRLPVLPMLGLAANDGYLPDLTLAVRYRHLLDVKAYSSPLTVTLGVALRLPFIARIGG